MMDFTGLPQSLAASLRKVADAPDVSGKRPRTARRRSASTTPQTDGTPKPARRRSGGAASAAPAGTKSKALPVFMQPQQEDNWCWSAVATSVGLLFGTGSWTQCDTASACLKGRPKCCADPGPCNTYGYLNQSLQYTKSLQTFGAGKASPARIIQEIDAGRPVCLLIQWTGTGGGKHFIAITGYSGDESNLSISTQDSIYGNSSMALSDFPTHYHTGGEWVWTYYTLKG